MIIIYYIFLCVLIAFAVYGFCTFLHKQNPELIFEIDKSDPEDVKFSINGKLYLDEMQPGRVYYIKAKDVTNKERK